MNYISYVTYHPDGSVPASGVVGHWFISQPHPTKSPNTPFQLRSPSVRLALRMDGRRERR